MGDPPAKTKLVKPLNEEVSRRICTGQVVISLSGACRELLDNALDAGATNIEVRVKENGTQLLEVVDNGSGIESVNFDALCKPHSTSKLSSITDFQSLTTFGFRGEALNALAELSNVSITTRHSEAPVATKLTFDNRGEVTRKEPCARQVGTTISVAELFSPLPVRRQEFVRTARKEFLKMLSTIQSFALSRTDVRFSCVNFVGGKRIEMLSTPGGSATVKETISSLFGARSEKGNILDVVEAIPDDETKVHYGVRVDSDAVFDTIKLSGYVSSCEYGQGRHSADRQFVYVNKRPVDFAKVCRIANEVYNGYNRGQYCMLVLFIEVDPATLDVNISPDKRTVFLHAEKELFAKIRASLRATFEKVVGKCPKSKSKEEWSTLATQSQISNIFRTDFDCTAGGSEDSFITVGDENLDTSRTQLSDSALPATEPADISSYSHIDNNVLGESFDARDADFSDGERNSSRASDLFREVYDLPKRSAHGQSAGNASTSKRPSLALKTGANSVKASTMKTLEAFAFKTARELVAERAALANGQGMEVEASTASEPPSGSSVPTVAIHQPTGSSANPNTSSASRNDALQPPSPATHTAQRVSPLRNEQTATGTQMIVNAFHAASVDTPQGEADFGVRRTANQIQLVIEASDSTSEEPAGAGDGRRASSPNDVLFVEASNSTTFVTSQSQTIVRPQQSVAIDLKTLRERMQEVRRQKQEQTKSADELDLLGEDYRLKVERSKDLEADQPAEVAEQNLSLMLKKEDFARMRVIGQFNSAFVVARLDNQLFVVDQHASDEKYNFEQFQRKARVQSQKLITPQPLQVGALHEAVLRDNIDIFRANGFDFTFAEEGSADGKVRLSSVPVLHGWQFDRNDVDEILGVVADFPGTMYRPVKLRKIFASRACRKSVMFGDPLSRQQMEAIIRHMGKMDQPWNCPHGRPTIRHLCTMHKVPADSDAGKSGQANYEDINNRDANDQNSELPTSSEF